MREDYALSYLGIAIVAGIVPVLIGRWLRIRDERRQQFEREHKLLLETMHRLEDHIAWDDMNDQQRDAAILRRLHGEKMRREIQGEEN